MGRGHEPTRRFPGCYEHLHFDALISLARNRFDTIPDARHEPTFSLPDTLLASLALFALKDPSLLAFQRRTLDHNLRRKRPAKHVARDGTRVAR